MVIKYKMNYFTIISAHVRSITLGNFLIPGWVSGGGQITSNE